MSMMLPSTGAAAEGRARLLGARSRLALALLACALLAGAASASASADSYGQLTRFGLGLGKYKITEGTNAFGVDPVEDSVFVGEEGPEKNEEESGEYRIQRFSATGAVEGATKLFKPKNEGEEPEPPQIEGVAVDAADETIYVLALFERSEAATADPFELAAGTLYAFKAKPNSKKELESAVAGAGAAEKEGVLASPTTLGAAATGAGEALLNPSGIAFDPASKEVIIAGEVDEGAGAGKGRHLALQRVGAAGALGARYVAPAPASELEEANSPVVSQGGSVYMQRNGSSTSEQIITIPSDFKSSAEPTVAFHFNTQASSGPVQELVEFDDFSETAKGGGLSFVAEGAAKGTIYSEAEIEQQGFAEGKITPEGGSVGALALDYEEGAALSERGWTGGHAEEANKARPCEIAEGGETYPLVAAGGGEKLFVLVPDTLEVVELGPAGEGCPHATVPATPAIVATAGTAAIAEGQGAAPGTTVTLSSTVVMGNALSVEWSFGDGAGETITYSDESIAQLPEARHTFAKEGEFTVKARIKTDDLASPELTLERKLIVRAAPGPPPGPTPPGPPASGTPSGTAPATSAPSTPPTSPKPAVASPAVAPIPDARLASTSLTASSTGIVAVKVSCPAAESSCTGTVALRTLGAVSASAGRQAGKAKPMILTLASGSFKLAGGHVTTVKLRLSAKARALLARLHTLHARATIVARDPAGAKHTTLALVTIRRKG